MASNRRRSARSIGKLVSNTNRRLRFLQRRPSPRRIGARVITTRQLRRRIITTPVIDDDAVTTPKLDENAVDNRALAPDAVDTENIAPGAVERDRLDDGVTEEIEEAQRTADGKNKVYRQGSAPTTGPFAVGDLWFDTDDDNKHYRWNGSEWVGFTLGDGALDSISANKITAGTIDASVITVSNIDAGNISTGLLDAQRIAAGSITSREINSSYIEGVTINGGQINGGTIAASTSFVIGNGATVESSNGLFRVGPNGEVNLNSIRSSSGNIAVNCQNVGFLNVINASGGINGQVATTPWTDGRYRRLGVAITGADIQNGTIRADDCDIGTGSGQLARGSHVHDVQGSSGSTQLSLTGNAQTISHTHTSGTYAAAISTRRLKKEIAKYEFDTSKLLKTKLVKFKYKNQAKAYQNNKDWAYGYIAEDLMKIGLEEVVGYSPDGRVASVNYGVLSTLVLELVKEHHIEIEEIKNRLDRIGRTK
ncbi:putative minor structural protein [Actinomycetia phage DSL-LC01]|nr:putative minor structural protein [Actinomycetia phage DSL-LC01]